MSEIFCQDGIDELIGAVLYLDTFTIQAMTLASNGAGEQTETWANETTGVAGFMETSNYRSNEAISGEHQQEERRWSITLASGTVDASKRLVKTHAKGVAITPRTFKILYVMDGETLGSGISIEAVETPNVI